MVELYTAGKLSKKNGECYLAYKLVGDDLDEAWSKRVSYLPPSLTAMYWEALYWGLWEALRRQLGHVKVYSPSVSCLRALETSKGGKYDSPLTCIQGAWSLLMADCHLLDLEYEQLNIKDMPDMAELLKKTTKDVAVPQQRYWATPKTITTKQQLLITEPMLTYGKLVQRSSE